MKIRVRQTDLRVLNMRTRMPFKYGIATLTALPHLFVRLELDLNGTRQWGLAADGLAPKWFTKDPQQSFEEELVEMLDVIRRACGFAAETDRAPSVFDLWQSIFRAEAEWGAGKGYAPLLWSFGVSLVERAMIDAFCRGTDTTFGRAIRDNSLGIRLGDIHDELTGHEPADLLPVSPLKRIAARHTVGLADPIADDDLSADDRLNDGLPQSLAACVEAYGLTHLKIKLCGEPNKDRHRLEQIMAVIGQKGDTFAFTLDGNEQFRQIQPFAQLWASLLSDPGLSTTMGHLLFVEQPFHRDMALSDVLGTELRKWSDRPPMIIDESDATLDSLPLALDCGYVGTSHKNCKGVFKSIANAALLEHRRRQQPHESHLLSGEDLANVGPVALLQDLAVASSIGIDHVERNGHHYFKGLSMFPDDIQQQVLDHHGDLYRQHEAGFPTLAVRDGLIHVGSIVDAPFGIGFELDPSRFTALDDWRFDSLNPPLPRTGRHLTRRTGEQRVSGTKQRE